MLDTPKNKPTVVINSTLANAHARRILLDSLQRDGDNDTKEIIVVVGGCAASDVILHPGARSHMEVRVTHNSIDFTGLIALYELGDGALPDRFLYIHDTCRAGPRFWDCARHALEHYSLATLTGPSMNMGVYSREYVQAVGAEMVATLKNDAPDRVQEYKRLGVDMEDFVFKRFPTAVERLPGRIVVHPPRDVYGNGIPRLTTHCTALDLDKYQANWHPKEVYTLGL